MEITADVADKHKDTFGNDKEKTTDKIFEWLKMMT
jgi:hypothetical protein